MLLSIKGLKTHFFTIEGVVKAVDGIDLEVPKGKVLGLVGESGSGKSVTGLSILRLIPRAGKIVSGKIIFEGENLLEKSEEEMRKVRGGKISMIFQDPTASLNPVLRVGLQISESLKQDPNVEDVEANVVDMLSRVGIPDAEKRKAEYPHQYSGGMRQRAMIAIAMCRNPNLIIADEPTTNLDVTIQAQILDLMQHLQAKYNSSVMMITHDLGVIAELADNVAVMYCGKIMEFSDVNTIFTKPRHPYTQALLTSIPRLDVDVKRLKVIKGMVASSLHPPKGCRFHPRCEYYRKEICHKKVPPLKEIEKGHKTACLRVNEINWEGSI